jgi:hypothetical protein
MAEPTIGEYFGNLKLPLAYQPDSACDYSQRVLFDRLVNNQLNRYAPPCRAYAHWPELMACCKAVIESIAELPFAGNITLAKIMADGMQMLKERHELAAPGPWYPTIKKLRENPTKANG